MGYEGEKAVTVHATQAYRGRRGTLLLILLGSE